MSEDKENNAENNAEKNGDGAPDAAIALQEKLDAMSADNQRLQAKINESNKHTKAAESRAAAEEKERLKAASNYEQLFKSSELQREELLLQIESRDKKAASSSEESAALALANSLTKDPKRGRLLAKELKSRFKYTEEGLKITDKHGNLTVSSPEDLRLEVQKNPDYDFLIDGVDSSGGGAAGSNNNSGAGKVINRAEFAALNPVQQMAFSKDIAAGKAEIT